MTAFLTESEVDELTGIYGGYKGKSKYQRQREHLDSIGIKWFPNVMGAPKVPMAFIEGKTDKPAANWQPAILRA